MSSDRASKRQKLQHPGSRSNPIQISDDETDSEAGDFGSPAPEPDSLQHVLSGLDSLNRDEHLAMVLKRVRIANTSQDTLKTLLESFTATEQEIECVSEIAGSGTKGKERDTTFQAEATSNGQTVSLRIKTDSRRERPIARVIRSSDQIERLLHTPGRARVYVRELSEAVGRWANALDDLYGLWESLWEIYDAMTKPGPSSMPLKIRELWAGRNPSMLEALERIDADVQIAEGRVDELSEALLKEAATHAGQE